MQPARFLSGLSGIALAGCVAFGVAGSPAAAQGRADAAQVCSGLKPGPTRTVARVVDGETLALDDGSEVRLIGALAPRAGDAGAEPGRWPPELAAIAELEAVVLAKSVELSFGGEPADRYGRALAHLTVREGDRRRWLQGHMLEQGLARAYVQAGNRACAAELIEAERIARTASRGLWAEAAYAVRAAGVPPILLRRRSSFQIVEGHVERVGQGRSAVYLDFGVGRGAFSVSLRRRDRELLGASAGNPKALEGRLVRVRGWIERRSGTFAGPLIDLSTAGLIEVLEPGQDAMPDAAGAGPRRRDRGGARLDPAPQREDRGQARDAKTPSLAEVDR